MSDVCPRHRVLVKAAIAVCRNRCRGVGAILGMAYAVENLVKVLVGIEPSLAHFRIDVIPLRLFGSRGTGRLRFR